MNARVRGIWLSWQWEIQSMMHWSPKVGWRTEVTISGTLHTFTPTSKSKSLLLFKSSQDNHFHIIWHRTSIWAGPVSETVWLWSESVFWRPENFRQKNPAWEFSTKLSLLTYIDATVFFIVNCLHFVACQVFSANQLFWIRKKKYFLPFFCANY